MNAHTVVLTALLAATGSTALAAQDFRWSQRVETGKWLEVKGINGDVRALPATGAAAEVTAQKTARRSDPESVEIRVVEHDGGVAICAVYPTPPGARRENTCEPGDDWHSSNSNNDVRVNFTVRVPAGVKFRGETVNGEIDVTDLRGDAQVSTVNGDVHVSTTGTAEAHTVNGSITANMGRADWSDGADFRTVNGAITLTIASELHVELRAKTVNGDIESDWPVTVHGRLGPKRVTGTIGNGGRILRLETVNGDIRLRKSS